MATPAKPATSAIFRALRSVDVDPDLAYEAAEESRRQAGENVIAAIGAQITELKAGIDTQGAEIRAEIKAQTARIDAQTSRIDVLQRVIWPLIGLLATTVFGLLYKARYWVTTGPERTKLPPVRRENTRFSFHCYSGPLLLAWLKRKGWLEDSAPG